MSQSEEPFLLAGPLAAEDPEAVLDRWWDELRGDRVIAPLAALVPAHRALTILDAIPLIPAALPLLSTAADQLRMLEAAVHAYARARGLDFVEK